jgi:hypothetical protein
LAGRRRARSAIRPNESILLLPISALPHDPIRELVLPFLSGELAGRAAVGHRDLQHSLDLSNDADRRGKAGETGVHPCIVVSR